MAKKQQTEQEDRPEAERLEAERAGLVKMTRDPEFYPAPHSADVHPDEVGNYAAAGWITQE